MEYHYHFTMNYKLASAILKNKWAIETQFALNSSGLIANILANNVEIKDATSKENRPLAISKDMRNGNLSGATYTSRSWDDAPVNSIALIKLQGTLMKNSQECGPIGMAAIGEQIKEADKNPNFSGILLQIDSPGGTVDGTQTLAEIVKHTQKPIIAYVDGLMASAALWVGSSADEIIASTPDDEVGSVGVLMSFIDIQPYWESLGVKFHTVTASQSTEKVKMWEELRDGKYDGYKKEFLDPIAQTFINAVKENRPGITDEHLSGKVFLAKNSIGLFVDSIGKFEDALDRIYDLADKNRARSQTNNGLVANNNSKIKTEMKQYKNVNAALGVETLEAVDQAVSLNEEQLKALDSSLGKAGSDDLQPQLDTANTTIGERDATIIDMESQIETAGITITERNATIGQLKQEVADLKGEPAEPAASAPTKTDGEGAGSDGSAGKLKAISDKYENPFDALDEVAQEYLGKSLKDK